MKFVSDAKTVSIVAAAAFAVLVTTATPAAAEPATAPFPVPAPLPASALPVEADVPAQTVTNSAAEPAVEGVPHLMSPENLPPGTSDAPATQSQPRLTYLRDLWHAMRTQEVSGGDALLLLTQRPMDADAAPPRGLATGPQAPLPATPLSSEPPPSEAPPIAPPAEAPPIAP